MQSRVRFSAMDEGVSVKVFCGPTVEAAEVKFHDSLFHVGILLNQVNDVSFSCTCGEQAWKRLKGQEDVKRRIGRCDSVVLERHGVESVKTDTESMHVLFVHVWTRSGIASRDDGVRDAGLDQVFDGCCTIGTGRAQRIDTDGRTAGDGGVSVVNVCTVAGAIKNGDALAPSILIKADLCVARGHRLLEQPSLTDQF